MDRLRSVNHWQPSNFIPFRVAQRTVGRIRPRFAEQLRRWPHLFVVSHDEVRSHPDFDSASIPQRNQWIANMLTCLRAEQQIPNWRDENYPVVTRFGEPLLFEIERAAIPLFGLTGIGVHINGLVQQGSDLRMWIAQRAANRSTAPNELDQLAAGGQPVGLTLRENAAKEAFEEAGVPLEYSRTHLKAVGMVSYCLETKMGLRPDLIYCFDLVLPPDFTPQNQDGEVAAFFNHSLEEIADIVREQPRFKFNSALVVIDCLIRRGLIEADAPDYAELVYGLRYRPAIFDADSRVSESPQQ